MSSEGKLFDDLFTVTTLDKGGKKFDRGQLTFTPPSPSSLAPALPSPIPSKLTTTSPTLPRCPPVSRIEASSSALSMTMTLDINMDLFPLGPGDRITVLLASTLHGADNAKKSAGGGIGPDGEPIAEDDVEDRREAWRGGDEGLAADYDYVTYGKVSRSMQSYSQVMRGTDCLSRDLWWTVDLQV